jgi:hypothetical protein
VRGGGELKGRAVECAQGRVWWGLPPEIKAKGGASHPIASQCCRPHSISWEHHVHIFQRKKPRIA